MKKIRLIILQHFKSNVKNITLILESTLKINVNLFQFQPPFDSLKFLGVHIDPNTGVVDIRDEPIYRGAQPNLVPAGPKGVYAAVSEYSELSQPNVIPYFAMPENYHGNQLKSYGGYLRYTVRHSDRGYPTPGPTVIITVSVLFIYLFIYLLTT